MPKAGVNQDPLTERVVFGFDGANYRVVKVDTDGNLVIALKTIEDVQANSYGWQGADWRKDPLRLGYSDTLKVSWSDTNLAAGTNTVVSAAVPADTLWVGTSFALQVISATVTSFSYALTMGGTTMVLQQRRSPVTSIYYGITGEFVLKAGDMFAALVYGATAGDNLYARVTGYSIDIV